MRTLTALAAALAVLATSCQFATDFRHTYDADGPLTSADLGADFEVGIYHRDDVLVDMASWPGDHVATGPDGECSGPSEKRTIERGERSEGFNDDWIYVCVPGGDPAKTHVMTSIGDTSGYSIGAFAPATTFTDVDEVRWAVNITDLGTRQWTEVKVIPAGAFDFQNLPCAVEWLPCDTSDHGDLGSVGTTFFNHEVGIHDGSELVTHWATWGGPWLHPDDPALSDLRERREHVFRDNGDGTLTFAIEQADGSFFELTTAGAFPDGDVRVVFADHNYTPNKDLPGGFPDGDGDGQADYTWHWDDIVVR